MRPPLHAAPHTAIPAALLAMLVLAGCTSPGLHANIGIGAGGVSVSPVATARVGGAQVSVRP